MTKLKSVLAEENKSLPTMLSKPRYANGVTTNLKKIKDKSLFGFFKEEKKK